MTFRDVTGNSLAGYRLVRRLGSGSRADVFLGAGETGPVALKVFHEDVDVESIGNELDALGRLDSPHFLTLRDVASTEKDVPILILERVQRGSVGALVRDRDSLEKGEVVTLLAPLAGALPALHRLGVAHGRIGASSLHLGANGEPVLIGFGHCELFARDGSIAAIDAQPAAERDRSALADLTIALLSRVRNAATDTPVVRLIEWIDSASREYELMERLEARLFDLADPIAIEFGPGAQASTGMPLRFGSADRALPAPEPVPTPSPVEPDRVLARIDAILRDNPIDVIRSRAFAFAKGVRKPFWFAAAGVVIALVLTLALLPEGSSSEPVPPEAVPTATVSPPSAPALPADPVLALPILLTARAQCIREMSVLCLDGVDEASSSAYSSDAELIEQLQGGTEIPTSALISAAAPSLTETLGATALVSLGPDSNPASVLMIRAKAGWRIRGYLSGIQATGSPDSTG
ncbi:MAG TPA: protein kinase [Galbitalea sp.]|nr:protein kinase [Galbitalea sp.]